MSMAYLDTAGSGMDRSGKGFTAGAGTADPRLIQRVGRVKINTPDEYAATERAIARHAHSFDDAATLRSMLGLAEPLEAAA